MTLGSPGSFGITSPSQGHLTSSLDSSTTAIPPLPCDIMYSQVWGKRMWTPLWVSHYSVDHRGEPAVLILHLRKSGLRVSVNSTLFSTGG